VIALRARGSSDLRHVVRVWGRWVVGLAILLLVAFSLDIPRTLQHLASANLPLTALGVGGLTAIHLVGAWTWRELCKQLSGFRLGVGSATSRYYAAQALGGLTPANLGGDAYRIYALRAAGFDAAVAPVIVQRATSYLALSLLGFVALVGLAPRTPLATGILAGVAIASVLSVLVALVLLAPSPALRWVRSAFLRLMGTPRRADAIETRPLSKASVRAAATGVVLGLVFHAGAILFTYLLVLAVLPTAPLLPVLAALAAARQSLSVPISPSGIGVQEAVLVVLFAGIGLSAEGALAAMLLSRVALLTTTAVGAAALLADRGRAQLGTSGSTA